MTAKQFFLKSGYMKNICKKIINGISKKCGKLFQQLHVKLIKTGAD